MKLRQAGRIDELRRPTSPKLIADMCGYRAAMARNLANNLQVLGLEKPPPPIKTLEQILAEDGNDNGGKNEQSIATEEIGEEKKRQEKQAKE